MINTDDYSESIGMKNQAVNERPDRSNVRVHKSSALRKRMAMRKNTAKSETDDEEGSVSNDDHQPTEPGGGFEDLANDQKTSHAMDNDARSESNDSYMPEQAHQEQPRVSNPPRDNLPRPGFASIEDEKQDYLAKFKRLRDRNVKLSQQFHMNSDIRDLRHEYDMLKKASDAESAVKFQRKALIAICSAMEWGNKKWDPFAIELDGWSEQVCESIEDYDRTFERLHEKYTGKAEMPPEAELMLAVAGSAFTFHLSHQFFKNNIPTDVSNLNNRTQGTENIMRELQQQQESAKPAQQMPPQQMPQQQMPQQQMPQQQMPQQQMPQQQMPQQQMPQQQLNTGGMSGISQMMGQLAGGNLPTVPTSHMPFPQIANPMQVMKQIQQNDTDDSEDNVSITTDDASLDDVKVLQVPDTPAKKGAGGRGGRGRGAAAKGRGRGRASQQNSMVL